jgi:glycosidase
MMTDDKEAPRDYIFGELDQPENSAPWVKERLSGVRHFSRKAPLAPKPGDAVILKVTTDAGQAADAVYVWFTTDDWQTTQEMQFEKTHLTWNSIAWTYVQEWQVPLPPQSEGVMLRYKIGAKVDNAEGVIYSDNQAQSFDAATQYSIWYGGECNPDWAKQAVVYQVFVDRFNPGKGKEWAQTSDVCQPFGGTLAGVIEKLPYIKDMGFNAIWLTPIFVSPTHHGYDISDYFQINPRFGTLEDFKHLISEAHRLEIRVILDFVANHCSNEHPNFIDALQDQNSKYHDWFVWKKWPQYESFFDVGTMPKINLAYGSPAREHLLSAVRYWLDLGVDGYRLDYAYGPEHDFWVDFRRACVSANPDIWTFGELVLPADVQASYADSLGGSLDFLLCQALRSTMSTGTWTLSKFAGFLDSHFRYFPEGHSLPSFIDNHDMDRFYTIANDDLRRLKLALLMLYLLPGPPNVYYGTEIPLSQNRLLHDGGGLGFDEARLEMDWQNEEAFEIKGYLKKLADIRSQYAFEARNPWHMLALDEDQETLVLATEGEKELLIINRSDLPRSVTLPMSETEGEYLDLLNNESYRYSGNQLTISISPVSGMILSR